ncbi:hypothetical protein SARC_09500 [Sphaeroforma arctica JP610]|uniref:Uncharacterized protein n=1 Tax=Sphaeroforma arctica JP610 TaxID=667725 RepID=A0A0L0FMR7_9EUKA|nr:hypothetical protein SARC_09500 [Sphaeroforma arctica JP610]KNC78054.1 hypothetical protein SARC_09500 [Sphaeroforma arctica JP610]|eukprot:XP_014151956.1 hypothetical protein SARC_09500 [Sphaeroforma arctica JP610]
MFINYAHPDGCVKTIGVISSSCDEYQRLGGAFKRSKREGPLVLTAFSTILGFAEPPYRCQFKTGLPVRAFPMYALSDDANRAQFWVWNEDRTISPRGGPFWGPLRQFVLGIDRNKDQLIIVRHGQDPDYELIYQGDVGVCPNDQAKEFKAVDPDFTSYGLLQVDSLNCV